LRSSKCPTTDPRAPLKNEKASRESPSTGEARPLSGAPNIDVKRDSSRTARLRRGVRPGWAAHARALCRARRSQGKHQEERECTLVPDPVTILRASTGKKSYDRFDVRRSTRMGSRPPCFAGTAPARGAAPPARIFHTPSRTAPRRCHPPFGPVSASRSLNQPESGSCSSGVGKLNGDDVMAPAYHPEDPVVPVVDEIGDRKAIERFLVTWLKYSSAGGYSSLSPRGRRHKLADDPQDVRAPPFSAGGNVSILSVKSISPTCRLFLNSPRRRARANLRGDLVFRLADGPEIPGAAEQSHDEHHRQLPFLSNTLPRRGGEPCGDVPVDRAGYRRRTVVLADLENSMPRPLKTLWYSPEKTWLTIRGS